MEDRKKHVMVLNIKNLSVDEFTMQLKDSVRDRRRHGTGKGEVLVFVHGYNVTFGDALRQTAQLAFDLAFEGAPILYSWPASGNKGDYARDKDQAGLTIGSF